MSINVEALTPDEERQIRDRMDVWSDYGPDPTNTILRLFATLDKERARLVPAEDDGRLREALRATGWWPDLDPEDYEPLAQQLRAALAATPAEDEGRLRETARELVDAIDEGRPFTNKVLRVRAALAATPERRP